MSKRRWTAEKVLSAIRNRYKRGWKYNSFHMQRNFGGLYEAGVYRFGTWNKAIAAAGVPVPLRNTWSKEIIVQKIEDLAAQGEPLNTQHIKTAHGILYTVAGQYFGGWGLAVIAAGIDYENTVRIKMMRKWSKPAVIEEILRRQREGQSVSGSVVLREDPGLYDAAFKYFGVPHAWANARLAAGLPARDLDPRYIHDPKIVVRELKRLYEQGVPIHYAAMRAKSYEHLVSAGRRLFGSYPKAVRAAGIDYQKVQKNRYNWWTKKRIVTEIRELNRQGVSLSGGSIFKSHQNLAHGAMRKFGSWGQAVEAAGISYRKHLKTWSTKFWLRTMSDDRYNQMLSDAQRYAQRRQKRRRKKK